MKLRYTLAFFLPFLLFVAGDLAAGRTWYSFPNDNIPGYFGLGLNVVTGSFPYYFHHPSYSFMEFAGILSYLNLDAPSLDGFFIGGLIFQIGVALFVAVWVAALALHLKLDLISVVALSAMVTLMPTVALYAPLYCTYAPAGLLLIPVSLGVVAILSEDAPPRWIVRATLFAIGFLAANLFMTLCIPVALGAGLLWLAYRRGRVDLARRLGPPVLPEPWGQIVFFALTVVVLRSILDIARKIPFLPDSEMGQWLVALAAIPFLWLLVRSLGWLRDFVLLFLLPIAASWAIFCNVHILAWTKSAAYALWVKGFASPMLPPEEVIARSDVGRFLVSWNWHGFMALAGIALIAFWFVRQSTLPGNRLVAGVGFAILALSAIVGADVSFLRESRGWYAFGQESRYQFATIAAVAIAMTMLALAGRRWRRVMLAATVVVGALSLADYVRAAADVFPKSDALEARVMGAINQHLAADSGNVVVCARPKRPSLCALLYGYNNYRLPDSLEKLSRREIRGGRLIYTRDTEEAVALKDTKVAGANVMLIVNDVGPILDGGRLSPLTPTSDLGPYAVVFPRKP